MWLDAETLKIRLSFTSGSRAHMTNWCVLIMVSSAGGGFRVSEVHKIGGGGFCMKRK